MATITQADLVEQLLARSVQAANGCRRWTGPHHRKGYGHISIAGRVRRAHIVAHEVWIGPVPDGYEVDHVYARGCRYRDCIEPAHLEAVTHATNVRRARELITHCPKGHEYTPANIKWVTKRGVRCRRCRRCFNDARSARRAAIRRQRGQ